MNPELILKIEAAANAVNAANDALRAELAAQGITTAENYFSISENKPLLEQLLAVQA
jgi:hypothetical protein